MKRFWAMVVIAGSLLTSASAQQTPITMDFTKVPGSGEGPDSRGDIGGRVQGLDRPDGYKVVIYAHTDAWYVQPLGTDSGTAIAADGRWSNWTHLGHRYAALVVRPSFTPSAKAQSLPAVGGDVVARFETSAKRD